MDQSPHQLAKAKAKPALKGVTILEVRGGQEGVRGGLRHGGRGRRNLRTNSKPRHTHPKPCLQPKRLGRSQPGVSY